MECQNIATEANDNFLSRKDIWAEVLPQYHGSLGLIHSATTFISNYDLSSLNVHAQELSGQTVESADVTIIPAKSEDTIIEESELKPPFAFELTTDSIKSSNYSTRFNCVYDFCLHLEHFCETHTQRLNIEKDWQKLLLVCSSHNYERFMWIHLTFQAANKLNICWKQVVRRLMKKFDPPTRPSQLRKVLSSFLYIPDMVPAASFPVINQKFARIADELGDDLNLTVQYYLSGLPMDVKAIVSATMVFDKNTNFNYTLLDVQQRAEAILTNIETKYLFYSKTAHLIFALDQDKMSSRDCEFHILSVHSTSSCPDLAIVKYPYMNIMPEIVSAVLLEAAPAPTSTNAFTEGEKHSSLTPRETGTERVEESIRPQQQPVAKNTPNTTEQSEKSPSSINSTDSKQQAKNSSVTTFDTMRTAASKPHKLDESTVKGIPQKRTNCNKSSNSIEPKFEDLNAVKPTRWDIATLENGNLTHSSSRPVADMELLESQKKNQGTVAQPQTKSSSAPTSFVGTKTRKEPEATNTYTGPAELIDFDLDDEVCKDKVVTSETESYKQKNEGSESGTKEVQKNSVLALSQTQKAQAATTKDPGSFETFNKNTQAFSYQLPSGLNEKINDEIKQQTAMSQSESMASQSTGLPTAVRKRSRSPMSSHSSPKRHVQPERQNSTGNNSPKFETGCILHGQQSDHTTKDCPQSQLLITRNTTKPTKSNNSRSIYCHYCGARFYRGHLRFCDRAPSSDYRRY